MAGQQSAQRRKRKSDTEISYLDLLEESKKVLDTPPQGDDTNNDQEAAAGSISVGKDVRDGLSDNGSIERKISAETAGSYGLDQEAAHRVLCDAAASRDARQYADTGSILHILTSKQIAVVVDGSTVGGLYRRFHALMSELVLPKDGFTTEHQAQLASQLSGTDLELRKHLAKLGIDWPKQEPVRIGDNMRTAFRRAQEKIKAVAAGHTLRRPGRPRRTDQANLRQSHN